MVGPKRIKARQLVFLDQLDNRNGSFNTRALFTSGGVN